MADKRYKMSKQRSVGNKTDRPANNSDIVSTQAMCLGGPLG